VIEVIQAIPKGKKREMLAPGGANLLVGLSTCDAYGLDELVCVFRLNMAYGSTCTAVHVHVHRLHTLFYFRKYKIVIISGSISVLLYVLYVYSIQLTKVVVYSACTAVHV